MPFNGTESEKLKEIEIMWETELGGGGAGPVFYNSRLSLYWLHLEKKLFCLAMSSSNFECREGAQFPCV